MSIVGMNQRCTVLVQFLTIFSTIYALHGLELHPKTVEILCEKLCLEDEQNITECHQCKNILDNGLANTSEITQELYCKSNDILSLKLEGTDEERSYVVEKRQIQNNSWVYVTNDTFSKSTILTVNNLESNTTYKIRTWIYYNTTIYAPLETEWITLPPNNVKPLPVKDLWANYTFAEDKSYAVVQWTPAEDLSCYYFFVYYNEEENDHYYIKNPKTLFRTTIPNIKYDQNHTISIRATNFHDEESEEKMIAMVTPPCLDIHKNLSICPPEVPENLIVETITNSENTSYYNLKISWSKPKYVPDSYEIHFTSYPPEILRSMNVSGETTEAIINNVKIILYYGITMRAWSLGGNSEVAVFDTSLKQATASTSSHLLIVLGSIGLFLFISSCIGSSVYVKYRISKKHKVQKRRYYQKDLEQKLQSSLNTIPYYFEMQEQLKDEWEIDPKNITLKKIIGQGAFGVVKHGLLTKGKSEIEVAVKTLKNSPTREEIGHFQHELEIMKCVGSHSHLVSLIGVCVVEKSGPMLVVEYCARGDLQHYLKSIWEKIMNSSSLIANNLQTDRNAREFENKLYDMEPMDLNEEEIINPRELLSFARQVAKGMEYLSKLKILHRDLAARNVLLCEDKTIKVSDFGLSRDVYQNNIYQKKAGGRLPIRWMAIESLTHQQYTTQSDVWSFGILLWEIVTLGGNPYPGIPTESLLKLLKDGYRMDCPRNCRAEIYQIMLDCWKPNPKERLNFKEIRIAIEDLLESETQYLQVDLDSCAEMNTQQTNSYKNIKNRKSVFERYVKPIWR